VQHYLVGRREKRVARAAGAAQQPGNDSAVAQQAAE